MPADVSAREALEHALTLAVTAIVRVRDMQPAGLIGELALELLGARGGTSDATASSADEVVVHCWERQGEFVVWLHPSANCRGAQDAAALLTLQEAIQQFNGCLLANDSYPGIRAAQEEAVGRLRQLTKEPRGWFALLCNLLPVLVLLFAMTHFLMD